jgi:hypothetical protein
MTKDKEKLERIIIDDLSFPFNLEFKIWEIPQVLILMILAPIAFSKIAGFAAG